MLKSVSELLRALWEVRVQQLDSSDVTHAPTIGEMYEGLSEHLLNFSLPPTTKPLVVASGFIRFPDGHLSPQLDCILGLAEPEVIPETNKKIFLWKNAIAIFEIKKRATKKSVQECLKHFQNFSAAMPDKEMFTRNFDDLFASIAGYRPELAEMERVRAGDFGLGTLAFLEAQKPLTVAWFHHGYKSGGSYCPHVLNSIFNDGEHLRNISSIPDLLIDEKNSLLKLNGLPYGCLRRDSEFEYLALTSHKPLVALIELILWRIRHLMDDHFPAFSDYATKEKFVSYLRIDIKEKEFWLDDEPRPVPSDKIFIYRCEQGVELIGPLPYISTCFQSYDRLPINDAGFLNPTNMTQSELEEVLKPYIESGFMFIHNDLLFMNTHLARTCFIADKVVLIEDVRGRSITLGGFAPEKKKANVRAIHIMLGNNVDMNVVSSLEFEYNNISEESSMETIGMVRYLHHKLATKLPRA